MDDDDEGVRSAVFTFHGAEYVVSLSVHNSNQLTVEVEERSSADQWRNTFDAAYIEDVTFKTGNFKKFSVFVDMLESAISQTSDAVSFDLLTYADLESLKEQKTGLGTKSIPGARTASGAPNNKKYLIVTYTVEFDRVHYPLPLPYVGKPDPRLLQNVIRQLRHEIKILKQQGLKDHRMKELETLRRDYDKLLKEKEIIESEYCDYKHQVELTTDGVSTKESRLLKNLIKNLEEELATSRAKYQRSTVKRNKQCQMLLEELEEVKASERNLRVRVKSLTNELAQYKRRDSRAFPNSGSRLGSSSRSLSRERSGSRHNSFTRNNTSIRSYEGSHNRSADKNLSRLSGLSARSRDRSLSHERPPSRGRTAVPRNRTTMRDNSGSRERTRVDGLAAGLSRLRMPSPSGPRCSRFDPTAYRAEKERQRQEIELKRKRMVRTRLSGSGDRKQRTKPSPSQSFNTRELNGHRRQPSRSPSVGSIRSVISSVESLSDSGMRSDSLERHRQADNILKSGRAFLAASHEWNGHSLVHENHPEPKSKVLSSTPEAGVRTRSCIGPGNETLTERSNLHERFDRSTELSEIDERLSRLQQFMKDNLQ